MEKFKKGDKVRLKSLEDIKKIDEDCNGIKDEYIEMMQEKVYTIGFTDNKYVKLLEDTKHFYFAISFLEKVPFTSFKLLPDSFSGTLKIEKGKVVEKIVKKEILDKTEKEIYELENQTQIISPLYVKENYIPKEAIREKIEKLKKELPLIGDCKNDCEKCFTQYRGSNFVYCYAYHQIKILKELLGE